MGTGNFVMWCLGCLAVKKVYEISVHMTACTHAGIDLVGESTGAVPLWPQGWGPGLHGLQWVLIVQGRDARKRDAEKFEEQLLENLLEHFETGALASHILGSCCRLG